MPDPTQPNDTEQLVERLPALLNYLHNLEKGYDRKFALQFLADQVWTDLHEAAAALQAAQELEETLREIADSKPRPLLDPYDCEGRLRRKAQRALSPERVGRTKFRDLPDAARRNEKEDSDRG